ncbi:hypothetical protein K1X12_02050 [Hyphomonas sp. WL0036]|uniref:hypothetical protein n=1 Tax=Hyphomonas sediminis TaxID=2866160 RepID=UPI001C8070F7|nr:hypothetical protein [Hyphomonas sediminis]MBY9065661.1 hypothetical protein [Hyphomonas sediminis]
MVQTHAHPNPAAGLLSALRAGMTFLVQLTAGLMLLFVAGLVAIITAIAGVALAAAAIAMRFAAPRRPRPTSPPSDGTITLEARRTPRGWTVE